MRLALLGNPIKHSLSPSLYREFLGTKLQSYELLEIAEASAIPSLQELAARLDGLNITAPYKRHFFDQVIIPSELVREIGALNTISFSPAGIYGTNTDVVAVESLLQEFQQQCPDLSLMILGSGVMARMTILVANKLHIPVKSFSRQQGHELSTLDLNAQAASASPLIINACSRDFTFQGKLPKEAAFWDYNYAFIPHQNTLPAQVSRYIDGTEMLRRQAQAAVAFWFQTNPKLKS